MPEEKPKRIGMRAKLRSYFLENVGKVMSSDELREVAGKSEWARRVRELRNEEGYQILTHNDRDDLSQENTCSKTPNPNLPSNGVFQKNSAHSFWIETDLPARCAEQSLGSLIHMMPPEKLDSIWDTLSTSPKEERMRLPIFVPSALSAMRGPQT
ncbi:MAG: hypothetical protein WCH40_00885 [Verrucomicrobiales bacterium]